MTYPKNDILFYYSSCILVISHHSLTNDNDLIQHIKSITLTEEGLSNMNKNTIICHFTGKA